MSIFLSPGVFSNEIDLSLYIPNLSTTALGLVGVTSKGPINVPTYVTNPVQFGSTFGDPTDPTVEFQPATYAALQYLHTGRQLWFVRVAEADPLDPDGSQTGSMYLAKHAKTSFFSEASAAPALTGTVNTLVTLTSSNKTMHFTIDGSYPGFDVSFVIPQSGSVVRSIPDIIALLNSDATFSTYLTASSSITGALVITGKAAGTSHSIQISGNNMTDNIFGFPKLGVTSYSEIAVGTGTIDEKSFVLGSGAFGSPVTIVTGTNDKLRFVLGNSATSVSNLDITVPAATYNTAASVAAALNGITAFSDDLTAQGVLGELKVFIKNASAKKYLALGRPADVTKDAALVLFGPYVGKACAMGAVSTSMIIGSSNNTLVLNGYDYTTPANDVTVTVTIPSNTYTVDQLVTALTNDAGFAASFTAAKDATTTTLLITTAMDDLSVSGNSVTTILGNLANVKKISTLAGTTILVQAASQGTWGNNLSIDITANTESNVEVSFNLAVYEKGYPVEAYQKLVLEPVLVTDPISGGLVPNPQYVETAINGVSARITVTNSSVGGVLNTLFPASTDGDLNKLTGGTNGGTPPSTSDPSLYIGVSDGVVKSGLQFFRNPEELDVNLLAVPGISDAAVINELIDICQTRADCMCLVDPPLGYTPQRVVNWVNGAGEFSGDHQAFNSSYAACYWPWLQIYDSVNKVKVFTPPSGHIANIYAYTDLVSDPWIAPAGLNRGHLAVPLKAEYNPTLGERDLLYSNNVNPVATFIRDGINVFGQKTLQRKPSALDRVNVRRLMLYLEKVVATAARSLLFEPDDATTWLGFVNLVDPFMAAVKTRRGLIDYEVRCDATTNTADALDRNEMHALIFLKPTKAAEFIQINFILTAQGANISELVF